MMSYSRIGNKQVFFGIIWYDNKLLSKHNYLNRTCDKHAKIVIVKTERPFLFHKEWRIEYWYHFQLHLIHDVMSNFTHTTLTIEFFVYETTQCL